MTENKMYDKRKDNIPVMRSCFYFCSYCAFQKFQKISKCEKCRAGVNHSHLEVLQRTPPKTRESEFITVGLSGDVSFMPVKDFWQVIDYCRKWKDRTFLIQSKNPVYFLRYQEFISPLRIPDNVILGTTIETNKFSLNDCVKYYSDYHEDYKEFGIIPQISYRGISKAPLPQYRYEAMLKLTCRKFVTIEPILYFDLDVMLRWMKDIAPEFIYIGYDNHNHKLPEPSLRKTQELINILRDVHDVREKTIRKAWYE